MSKIRLIFADQDTVYMDYFLNYIRSSKEAEKFEIKMFSSKENLEKYLIDKPIADILLISSSFQFDFPPTHQAITIYLQNEIILDSQDDSFTIYKYQPLNQLISQILSIYYEHSQKISKISKSIRTKTIAVYSAAGGTGKTTVAVQLCRQLALQNQKVFYLNLELFHSTSLYFSSPEDQPSSQILYYLKANPNQLLGKIESLKKRDTQTNVEYFDMAVSAEEMLEITAEEVERLLDGLVQTENYDYIILDLDSTTHMRIKAALKYSQHIIWVLNPDVQSFLKTATMIEEYGMIFDEEEDISSKSIYVLNRYSGKMKDEFKQFPVHIQSFLPFVEQWREYTSRYQINVGTFIPDNLLTLIKQEDEVRGASYAR